MRYGKQFGIKKGADDETKEAEKLKGLKKNEPEEVTCCLSN